MTINITVSQSACDRFASATASAGGLFHFRRTDHSRSIVRLAEYGGLGTSFRLTPICSYVLFSFSIHNTGQAMRTRGQVLADAVTFALIRARKTVRGLKQGLTDEDRRAVADDVKRISPARARKTRCVPRSTRAAGRRRRVCPNTPTESSSPFCLIERGLTKLVQLGVT